MQTTRPALILSLTALTLATWGCGRSEDPEEFDTNHAEGAEMGPPAQDMAPEARDMRDPQVDMPDGEADQPTDAPDQHEDMAPDPGPPCQDQAACADDEICLQGRCQPSAACSSPKQQTPCRRQVEDAGGDPTLAARAFCDGSYCKMACVRDADCGEDNVCTDNGLCAPFLGNLEAPRPGGEAPAPLQAGVGNTLMRFPIGVPLGGFGSRAGSDPISRYSDALTGSKGQYHGLYARAILLDTGERELLLVRLPVIFPTGPLHEAVARELHERTGQNWRDDLIISGTHTHSGPGRFLHLPPPDQSLLPLGNFGTDNYHDEAFDWVVDSTMDAIDAAFDDRASAALGWEIVESFDNDDAIASDRWGGSPPFDDNRLLLMRLDDEQGEPRALLFSLGIHGTFNSSDYATGDSMGGLERALEARFGQAYDRFVPALFFNQLGGTMSPRGDQQGHRDHQKFEHIGWRFVDRMWQAIEDIETDDDIEMDSRTLRFPLGYEELGYAPGEWSHVLDQNLDLLYGGLQCGVAGVEDDDYETFMKPDENFCFGIAQVMYGRPPTLFLRSQTTALQIDGLTVVTLPGEASMELGWQVLRQLREDHGIDPMSSWVWGYAQDHQFYLMPTNLRGELPPFPGISTPKAPDEYPDYAFSYYQGGYEAGFSIWGARMGDYLVERTSEGLGLLLGTLDQPARPEPYPEQYTPQGDPAFEIDVTDEQDIAVVAEPSEQVTRLAPLEFAWVGGDPGAEMPQAPRVELQRQGEDDAFMTVSAPNTRPYTNREPLMLTRLRPGAQGGWEWVVYWEELHDFPVGTYRFEVRGHRLDGSGQRVPYTLTSRPFALDPTEEITATLGADASRVSGQIQYPAPGELRHVSAEGDPGRVTGNYRMRHPERGTGEPWPLTVGKDLEASGVTVTIQPQGGGAVQSYTGADVALSQGPDGACLYELDLPTPLSSGTYEVTVEITDAHGNTGGLTDSLTVN